MFYFYFYGKKYKNLRKEEKIFNENNQKNEFLNKEMNCSIYWYKLS